MIQILLANSDRKLTLIHEAYLKRHFSVDSAHNGLSALRQASLLRPNVVVSDYHLPLISGLSLLKYIRSHRHLHSIPFIFLSDHLDASEALSLGANDWLSRTTTSPDHLAEKIYHHLKLNPHALQID